MNIAENFYAPNRDHADIRGFFFLKDSDGNIIRTSENMVVKSGRRLLMKSIQNEEANKLNFTKDTLLFKIGNNSELTSPDMTELKNTIKNTTSPEEDIEDIEIKLSGIDFDSENSLSLKISASISYNDSDPQYTFSELGLFYNNGTDLTMFSRVVFPEVSMKSGVSYNIDYYIYF